jgi:predicted nucleotidyltransferase
MKNNTVNKVLDYFITEIRNRLGSHVKRVILFGSRARGDQMEQSDYDCLVVIDEASSEITNSVDEVAGEALYKYGAVFSAFIVTERKLAQGMQNPFLVNVEREGIEL